MVNADLTEMTQSLLRRFCRSPHLYEVFSYTSSAFLNSILINFAINHSSLSEIINYFLAGVAVFTFIEYWFHRVILHEWIFKIAHIHHHNHPAKLKIICTPMIPVCIYGALVSAFLSPFIGVPCAVGLVAGFGISQMLMDLVHVAEHSAWRPWWLQTARDWHSHHHNLQYWDVAHGLTCCFWDSVFGTWPSEWPLYKRYPCIRWLQLPIPLFSTIILTPLLRKMNRDLLIERISAKNSVGGNDATHPSHDVSSATHVQQSPEELDDLPTLDSVCTSKLSQAFVLGAGIPWCGFALAILLCKAIYIN